MAKTVAIQKRPLKKREQAASAASDTARRAKRAGKAWVEYLLRFGYIVRGVIYSVLGVIALRLALGTRSEDMSQTGAIETIGHQPFGGVLLGGVAVGLAGYASWGVIRAISDPLREGDSPVGIAKRLGFVASAAGYAALLFFTLRFMVGSLRQVDSENWTATLLAKPYGAWLVGTIGVCWMGMAGVEIVRGYRGRFVNDLAVERTSAAERRVAKVMGRVGILTLGIVFAIIGTFLIATALHANPHPVTGMDGALLALSRQPFGRTLLSGAGFGFIVFGVFSTMCARWMRIRITDGKRSPSRN